MKLDIFRTAPKPATIGECHLLIESVWSFCATLAQDVSALRKEMHDLNNEVVIQRNERLISKNKIEHLERENADLKEKLNTNSNNSSKPPSSDLFKRKKKIKKNTNQSNRKPGGQPGHTGHFRAPLPSEKVDNFIECSPPNECERGGIIQKSADFKQHQVHELPRVKPIVTEYQLFDGICCGCGKKHTSELPQGVPKGMLGSFALSKVANLTGNYRLSKRNTVDLLQDFYGLKISIGTISNVEKTVSLALKAPVDEMVKMIPYEPIVFADETGHKEQNKKMWTWVAATLSMCVFYIRKGRKMEIAQEILGKTFSGILISDRFTAYNWVDYRQFCSAHLIRAFKKISERSGQPGRIGDGLLLHYRRIFLYWHWVKNGKMTRETFIKLINPIRIRVETLLEEGGQCGHLKTERTCRNISYDKDFLWTFIKKEGVEPTNNLSERLLRRFVIWRKTSFGTQSELGSRFMERVMSVAGTCQLQKKNVLNFISEAITSHLNAQEHPSLLRRSSTLALAT